MDRTVLNVKKFINYLIEETSLSFDLSYAYDNWGDYVNATFRLEAGRGSRYKVEVLDEPSIIQYDFMGSQNATFFFSDDKNNYGILSFNEIVHIFNFLKERDYPHIYEKDEDKEIEWIYCNNYEESYHHLFEEFYLPKSYWEDIDKEKPFKVKVIAKEISKIEASLTQEQIQEMLKMAKERFVSIKEVVPIYLLEDDNLKKVFPNIPNKIELDNFIIDGKLDDCNNECFDYWQQDNIENQKAYNEWLKNSKKE